MCWVSGMFQHLEEEPVRRLTKGAREVVDKHENVLSVRQEIDIFEE